MKLWSPKNVYLDYASSTPIDRKVLKILSKTEKDFFANGSAIYKTGVLTRELINKSRLNIAKSIKAHADEIIFTGSGTESDALAIFGVINHFKNIFPNIKPHVIVSEIEHPAVLENVKLLENKNIIEVSFAPVLPSGILDLNAFKELIKENTVLVSVMYANNEIGTIQPIEEIAKIIRRFRKEKQEKQNDFFGSSDEGGRGARPLKNHFVFPVFHTDACQAMNYLFTENIEKLGVDLLTFNSTKIYGPKGIGVLFKKRGVRLETMYSGGGQEMGLRSGTESVALIRGIDKALQITNRLKEKEYKRLSKLRDYGIEKILDLSKKYPFSIHLNGDKENRLPNNINISIEGLPSELLVIELSAQNIFVSEKSACKAEDDGGSYVIKALKNSIDQVSGSIRITMGRQTTKKDLDRLIEGFSRIFSKYKEWK